MRLWRSPWLLRWSRSFILDADAQVFITSPPVTMVNYPNRITAPYGKLGVYSDLLQAFRMLRQYSKKMGVILNIPGWSLIKYLQSLFLSTMIERDISITDARFWHRFSVKSGLFVKQTSFFHHSIRTHDIASWRRGTDLTWHANGYPLWSLCAFNCILPLELNIALDGTQLYCEYLIWLSQIIFV